MNKNIEIENIENLLIEINGQKVLLDRDIAKLYEVETKRINEAVKNNLQKFPKDYMFKLNKNQFENILQSKISSTKFSKVRTNPKAFSEKGLYMLATILKGKKAINTTFQIIETFAKIKKLGRSINQLSNINNEKKKNNLMQKSGEIFSELFENNLKQIDSETSFELNFAVLKFKHIIKKK